MSRLALPTLLSQTLIALTNEFEREGAGTYPLPSLTMWSNVLQYVTDDGVDLRQLPALSRLSKRAIGPAVTRLEKAGYVSVEAEGRSKTVRLTDLGRQARDAMRPMFDRVEKRWRERFGDDEIETLRRLLQELVRRFEFELSHYPASYGAADTSITGGGGQDWKFQPRVDGDTVSTLPLSALLSQALVAFSIDFEKGADWSLAATVNVLRFLSNEPQPIKDVPPVGALRWHGLVIIEGKQIRLSPRGRRALDAYEPHVGEVELQWRSKYGEGLIDELRRSLEYLVGQLDEDLPHHPSVDVHL